MYSVQVQSESLALAHSKQWKSTSKNSVEVGEVVKTLGKAAQMKLMTSKLFKEEVGEVVNKTNPDAGEESNKCDISFPHEPGADTELSKEEQMVKKAKKDALVKLLNKETMLKVTIKTIEDVSKNEVLRSEKLDRMSIKLEDSLSSYEDAYIAYQMLHQSAEVADLAAESQTVSKEEQSRSSNPEMKQESAACCNDQKLKQESSTKKVLISSRDQLSKAVKDWCEEASPIDKQGEDSKLKAEEVTNIASAKQRLTTPVLWRPWMSEVQGEAKLSSEAKQDRANMRAKLNLVTKAEEEVEKHADAKQLNYNLKAETEDRMQSGEEQAEQLKKVKQRLKEEKVSRYAMDWHELSPLIADKLVPPDREVEEIGAKDRLDEVEKDWQGSVPLAIDKQGQVQMSVTKKVVMKLLNTKAEAEQKRKSKMKLMEEMLLELLKQYIELKACEEEEHEALPLLIDKQAAAG